MVFGEIESALAQAIQMIHASLRPTPTQTGDGSYTEGISSETGILNDLGKLDLHDVDTIIALTKNTASKRPVDDKKYLVERVIQLASSLPSTSRNATALNSGFLSRLWNDLEHPPLSYVGDQFAFRQADGSYNNVLLPQLGATGSPYARTIQPQLMQPVARPDPSIVFDSLMRRKEFIPHPNKISSILFYLASIIIHDIFRTDRHGFSRSQTSSYLDLAPLYGSNQKEQNSMRTFKNGKLKRDCFSERRILGQPPGVGVLLIMFNRFQNFIVEKLALINENDRFHTPEEGDEEATAKYDNDLFQTGRLITCGLYVNCILKDYVRTILNINRTNSTWSLDPRSEAGKGMSGGGSGKGGGNQVSVEFNLIYRWHSCISERDEKFVEQTFGNLFPGEDPHEVGVRKFIKGVGKWEATMPEDPQQRPFAGFQREADGSLSDDQLVETLTRSVEDCAGAFGASNVPVALRAVEVLGIQQSRSWKTASLNEVRKYFHLAPHKTFEDINSDPYIAEQLKRLYDHPDYVELYPGIVIEEAKRPMAPGSGLCASFTMSRVILSDAVALVRGDRFYMADYTPKNLTNWGYKQADYDLSIDQGHVFYKILLRAFPRHFAPNSVYAHFPLVIPSENLEILSGLGISERYTWDKPRRIDPPVSINSHSACKLILENQELFKLTWGEAIEYLMGGNGHSHGKDVMLAGDGATNYSSRKIMGQALYYGRWEDEVKSFYENLTLKLLHKNAYKIAGSNQVDIVRDIVKPAQVHFTAAVFCLPLKSDQNPRGVYTESELYSVMALTLTCIFFNGDPTESFSLHQKAREAAQQLGKLLILNIQLIRKTGFVTSWMNSLCGNDVLPQYGVHLIRRMLQKGLSPQEIVWTHILPTASGMVANQAQLFSQCLDFYLSERGSVHLAEINRLSKLQTCAADDLLLRYFLEGARIGSGVALSRSVSEPTSINDGGVNLTLKPGQQVMCNLVSASMDPKAFTDPHEVKLDRDLDLYIFFGLGQHQCLGAELCKTALTTMLKTVGQLDNLRRTPGPQGHLMKVVLPTGIPIYMTVDESRFTPYPATLKIQWDGELPPLFEKDFL